MWQFKRRQLLGSTYLSRRALMVDGEGDGDGGDADGTRGGGGSGAGGEGDGAGGSGDGGSGGGLAESRANAGGDGEGAGEGGSGEVGGEGEGGGDGEGSADRPDGLPDAFWNAEANEINVPALLKGFKDTKAAHDRLVGNAGAGDKAPKDVDGYWDTDLVADGHMRLPEGEIPKVQAIYPNGVPINDPMIASLAESAHRNGVPQKTFLNVLGDFLISQEGAIPDAVDVDAELALLGENGKDQVDEYNLWADALKAEGLLNDEDILNCRAFGSTASEIRTMRKIMSRAQGHSSNNPSIITGDTAGEGLPSYEEWYAQIPSAKGNPTPADWKKWEGQGEKLFGTGAGGTSRSGLGMPSSRGASRQTAT